MELQDMGWKYMIEKEDLQLFQKLKGMFVSTRYKEREKHREVVKRDIISKLNPNIRPRTASRLEAIYEKERQKVNQQYQMMNYFYEILKSQGKAVPLSQVSSNP